MQATPSVVIKYSSLLKFPLSMPSNRENIILLGAILKNWRAFPNRCYRCRRWEYVCSTPVRPPTLSNAYFRFCAQSRRNIIQVTLYSACWDFRVLYNFLLRGNDNDFDPKPSIIKTSKLVSWSLVGYILTLGIMNRFSAIQRNARSSGNHCFTWI